MLPNNQKGKVVYFLTSDIATVKSSVLNRTKAEEKPVDRLTSRFSPQISEFSKPHRIYYKSIYRMSGFVLLAAKHQL